MSPSPTRLPPAGRSGRAGGRDRNVTLDDLRGAFRADPGTGGLLSSLKMALSDRESSFANRVSQKDGSANHEPRTTNHGILFSGLWGSSAAWVLSLVLEDRKVGAPVFCITPDVRAAWDLAVDLEVFGVPEVDVFPPAVISGNPHAGTDPSVLERLTLLEKCLTGRASVIVTPVQACLQEVPPRAFLTRSCAAIEAGTRLVPEDFRTKLAGAGFEPAAAVTLPREMALRGGILDFFPLDSPRPVRLEWDGDVLESIRYFDPGTQESDPPVKRLSVYLGGAQGGGEGPGETLFDYMPPGASVVLCDPGLIRENLAAHGWGDPAEFRKRLSGRAVVELESMPGSDPARAFRFSSTQAFEGNLGRLAEHLAGDINKTVSSFRFPVSSFPDDPSSSPESRATSPGISGGSSASPEPRVPSPGPSAGDVSRVTSDVIVFAPTSGESSRLREILLRRDVSADRLPRFVEGRLTRGFVSAAPPRVFLPHHEIFRRELPPRRTRLRPASAPIKGLRDVAPGDYVVHLSHGIGRYKGLAALPDESGGSEECLVIEYAEGGLLYVPASRISLVERYIGCDGRVPALSRLGGTRWVTTTESVKKALKDLSAGLLAIQAARLKTPGTAFPPDTEWQKTFELEFPYEETGDQKTVLADLKRDMERERPMDRLLCGDVGYGKTELAMRVAFKTVMAGKQVVVLVPTTVLAEQHARTFSGRMAEYPVVVKALSRMRTVAEDRAILEGARDGTVDILIGTHRLLQPDIGFKDLGLLIIDEEQRFGVEHKERLKRFRATVDILSLTATPIPRTLHLALLGLKDISALETPPEDRLPIITAVLPFDENTVREAVLRELYRNGQVYYLYNRVMDIHRVAGRLARLVPEARIAVAHGQMPEDDLEDAMARFVRGEVDVLVATTIVESGLDIPNANTILIEDAERYGLAELHQLRGRVGRYRNQAYAQLFFPPDKPLSPEAAERLRAIEAMSYLGAGFQISLKDLEIRGAGNILGREQHGHLAAVGYDLYCKLLAAAISGKAMDLEPAPEIAVQLGFPAFLPDLYIPAPADKIDFYRRIARAGDDAALAVVEKSLRDRFGPLPAPVRALLLCQRLRRTAAAAGVVSLRRKGRELLVTARDPAAPPPFTPGVPVTRLEAGIFAVPMPEGEGAAGVVREVEKILK
ncbi:MAG: transcription-repair coupling factor [Planctomycetota bacterium]